MTTPTTRQIRDLSNTEMIPLLIFAIVWNAGLWTLLAVVLRHPPHLEFAELILGMCLPAAGAILLIVAARLALIRVRYGRSVLDLQTPLCVPGGAVIGTIHLPRPITPAGPIQLRLACLVGEVRTFGTGDRQTAAMTYTPVSEQFCTLDKIPVGVPLAEIPVGFRIPHDAKPCENPQPAAQLLWRLEAKSKCSGIHYATAFLIPVFAGDVPPDVHGVHDPTAPFRCPGPAHPQVSDRGIHFTRLADGGCEADVDPGRGLKVVSIVFGIGCFFLLFGALIARETFRWHNASDLVVLILSIPFFALCCVIGGGLVAMTIGSAMQRVKITIRHSAVTLRRSIWLSAKERTYSATQITDIVAEIDTTLGLSTTYGVKLKLAEKKPVDLVGSMTKSDADLLAGEFKRAIGV